MNFYKKKKLFKIDDKVDVDKILVSRKKICFTNKSIKYFIEYNGDVSRPSSTKLPQMIGKVSSNDWVVISFLKCFDSNKTMFFKVINNKLLKKYNRTWERVRNLMKYKI